MPLLVKLLIDGIVYLVKDANTYLVTSVSIDPVTCEGVGLGTCARVNLVSGVGINPIQVGTLTIDSVGRTIMSIPVMVIFKCTVSNSCVLIDVISSNINSETKTIKLVKLNNNFFFQKYKPIQNCSLEYSTISEPLLQIRTRKFKPHKLL